MYAKRYKPYWHCLHCATHICNYVPTYLIKTILIYYIHRYVDNIPESALLLSKHGGEGDLVLFSLLNGYPRQGLVELVELNQSKQASDKHLCSCSGS